MERPSIPGSGLELPVLGADLAASLPAGPGGLRSVWATALVGRLVTQGVTFLDVGAIEAAEPIEHVVGGASGPGTPVPLCIAAPIPPTVPARIGGRPSPLRPAETPATDAEPVIEHVLAEMRRISSRCGRPAPDIVWVDPAELPALREGGGSALPDLTPLAGRPIVWGVRSPGRIPSPATAEAWIVAGVRVLAFPVHLLNAASAVGAAAAVEALGARVIALDPHGGGRLDGRLFGLRSTAPIAPPGRPLDPAALRRLAGPVLELAFLTEHRDRSLGEAALQFALGVPGVVAVEAAFADPGDVEGWTAALGRTPLRDDERRRVIEIAETRASRWRDGTS